MREILFRAKSIEYGDWVEGIPIKTHLEIVKMNMGDWTLDYSYLFRSEYGRDYCNLGFYAGERNCVQVIGNIFDNPELLEVKDDTNKPEVVAEEGK